LGARSGLLIAIADADLVAIYRRLLRDRAVAACTWTSRRGQQRSVPVVARAAAA
jgi:hypothetical protein